MDATNLRVRLTPAQRAFRRYVAQTDRFRRELEQQLKISPGFMRMQFLRSVAPIEEPPR